jgi:hypothetical protein
MKKITIELDEATIKKLEQKSKNINIPVEELIKIFISKALN